MSRGAKASVVVPTWDGRARLERLLPVLRAVRSRTPWLSDVVVVDDGGTDGTAGWLARAHPWVRAIRSERNRGFGAAANAGVLACRTPVVVLLNDDAVPERSFLTPLLPHFDDPEVFAVSCRQEPGGGLCRGRFHMGLLRLRWTDGWEGEAVPTLYADGGASAFRRDAFLSLGGFEAMYRPFYGEDLDLSYRAWKRGFRVLHEPASVVRHPRGGTIAGRFDPVYVRAASLKNRLLFVWRSVSDAAVLARHLTALPLRAARAALLSDRAWLSALRWAFSQRGEAAFLRRRDRRVWVRSDRQVLEESARRVP